MEERERERERVGGEEEEGKGRGVGRCADVSLAPPSDAERRSP